MARKRFTPEQIVAILREAERGAERKALFRKYGICEQTLYRWKRQCPGDQTNYCGGLSSLNERDSD